MNWAIVWVIMGRRGVSPERGRSGCYSSFKVLKSNFLFPYILDPSKRSPAPCDVKNGQE